MRKLIQSLLCGAALMSTLFATAPAMAAPELAGQVNINTASESELDLLPGVGPSIAKKVIAYRKSKKFGEITHLMRIRGIGRKTFSKLKPFLAVEGQTTLHVIGNSEKKNSKPTS